MPTYEFEAHLTTAPLHSDQLGQFINICTHLNCKPLLIELARGTHTQQPMGSFYYTSTLDEALKYSQNKADEFTQSGFAIKRIKIEVELGHLPMFAHLSAPESCHFEWHGQLELHNSAELLKLCEQHGSHLSRNGLKNKGSLRFVSIRTAPEDELLFRAKVADFKQALSAKGWPILKEQFEHCIFDNKGALDQGWLSK